jgi:hypothetical protein
MLAIAQAVDSKWESSRIIRLWVVHRVACQTLRLPHAGNLCPAETAFALKWMLP